MKLDLQTLTEAVGGSAAAFRCVTDYQPVGGPGDKVFPPTYSGGKYATEERVNPDTGELRQCVLLDSVQSQANRMELALLEAHRAGVVQLPLLVTRFDQENLLKKFSVTSLEAPHRIADALFRDSRVDDEGEIFPKSKQGLILGEAGIRNATGLFGLCPTSLVFGLWHSTGPRGGLGAKFQRALVSEVVGYDAVPGKNTSSRIDPAEIRREAGTLYERKADSDKEPLWTLNEKQGEKKLKRTGRPSEANHGNIPPDYTYAKDPNGQFMYDTVIDADGRERREPCIVGGFTISKATQTTTLSLAVLRRLRFPLNGAVDSKPEVDLTARTTLAALGLAAGTLARSDVDLRSRCHLFAQHEPVWELLDRPGASPERFDLDPDDALDLLRTATDKAKNVGLPWEGEIELIPSDDLVELVRLSQELTAASSESEDRD